MYSVKGKVLLNGEDVTNLSDVKCCVLRNKTFGYVVQDFALIEDETVYNNICLPLLYKSLYQEANGRRESRKLRGAWGSKIN